MTTIIIAGHCNSDGSRLAHLFKPVMDIHIVYLHTGQDILDFLDKHTAHLILLNRIFERTGEEGIKLIPRIRAKAPESRVMLISNYPEAQEAARAAGAIEGFGKAYLDDAHTRTLLKAAIT